MTTRDTPQMFPILRIGTWVRYVESPYWPPYDFHGAIGQVLKVSVGETSTLYLIDFRLPDGYEGTHRLPAFAEEIEPVD